MTKVERTLKEFGIKKVGTCPQTSSQPGDARKVMALGTNEID
jgi:hypothetical protein